MNLKTKKNNILQIRKYNNFEEFYLHFQELVTEYNISSYRIYVWSSNIVRKRFEIYYNIHSQDTVTLKDICNHCNSKEFSCNRKEFYIDRGYSEYEAIKIVSEKQKLKALKSKESRRGKKDLIPTQLGYWIKKGYSEEEATLKVKERQRTFTLEKCIQKYGEKEGKIIFLKRQQKWISSLNKSYSTRNKPLFSSLESTHFFLPFYNKLKNKYTCFLATEEIFNEYSLIGESIYFYDFTILELKIIFEYNGEAFHPNPKWSKEKWDKWKQPFTNKSADQVYNEYLLKLKAAQDNGFTVIQIWSSDDKENNIEIVKNILNI